MGSISEVWEVYKCCDWIQGVILVGSKFLAEYHFFCLKEVSVLSMELRGCCFSWGFCLNLSLQSLISAWDYYKS